MCEHMVEIFPLGQPKLILVYIIDRQMLIQSHY
jgi:hypothetical protein